MGDGATFLTGMGIFLAACGAYLLPIIVSLFRGLPSRKQNGIALLNVFTGWTVVGWFGALIWAVSAEAEK